MADYDPYKFTPNLAISPDNSVPLRNAVAQVYAPGDTGFTTPLPITDWQGVPMATLIASPSGMYPEFRCQGHTQVIAKSGAYATVLESKYGVLLEVGLEPAVVASAIAAGTSAGTARDQAVAARNQAEQLLDGAVTSSPEADPVVFHGVFATGSEPTPVNDGKTHIGWRIPA